MTVTQTVRMTLALAAMTTALQVHAAISWDEAVNGDLSGDRLAPTPVNFATGSNTVLGSMGPGEIDYLTFIVPGDSLLSAVLINPGTSVSGSSSFFAIQAGPQVTVTPSGGGTGPGSLLAFGHYAGTDVGTNLLAALLPAASPGLTAGTYSVWLNETGGSVAYSFDFVLSPVSEPAGGALLLTGTLALAGLRRRTLR